MTKKITVVIPVYNGASYLGRCIDSLLSQEGFEGTDLEIILIDDGSSDESASIIDQYATQEPGIVRAVHQANIGVARTRNKGIELAQSEYMMFVDQDDWIDRDYCRTFYATMQEHSADVVSGGYRRPDPAGRVRQVVVPSAVTYGRYIVMASWAKLHRTEFLRGNLVEFFPNNIGEDSVFTIKEIASNAKWHTIDYVGYNWFLNEVSVSNVSQRRLSDQSNDSLLRLLGKLHSEGTSLSTSFDFQYFLLRTVCFYLLFGGRRSSRSEFLRSYRLFFSWFDGNSKRAYGVRYLIGPKGERLGVRLAIAFMYSIHRTRLARVLALMYCRGH